MLGAWAEGGHEECRSLLPCLVGIKRNMWCRSDPRGAGLKGEGAGVSGASVTSQGTALHPLEREGGDVMRSGGEAIRGLRGDVGLESLSRASQRDMGDAGA